MKKLIIPFVSGILFTGLFAFSTHAYDIRNSTAEVNSSEGLLIFTDSKPVKETVYLGTVKASGRGLMSLGIESAQYTNVRNGLIKAAKKKYPDAEALIIELQDGGEDKADVVKFK